MEYPDTLFGYLTVVRGCIISLGVYAPVSLLLLLLHILEFLESFLGGLRSACYRCPIPISPG